MTPQEKIEQRERYRREWDRELELANQYADAFYSDAIRQLIMYVGELERRITELESGQAIDATKQEP